MKIKKIKKTIIKALGFFTKAYLWFYHCIFSAWFKVGLAFFKHIHIYSDKKTETIHTVIFTNKTKLYKAKDKPAEQPVPVATEIVVDK